MSEKRIRGSKSRSGASVRGVKGDRGGAEESCRSGGTEPEQQEGLLLYIQMQMCQQRSLKEWLAENTGYRSPELIYDIFDQLVIAVEYVHDNGLMHRDLKV